MTLTVTVNSGSFAFKDNDIRSQSGVYLVTTTLSDGKHSILYAGESEDINNRLTSHEKESCWERNKVNGLYYYFTYYCNQTDRMSLEKEIRDEYDPTCNKV